MTNENAKNSVTKHYATDKVWPTIIDKVWPTIIDQVWLTYILVWLTNMQQSVANQ